MKKTHSIEYLDQPKPGLKINVNKTIDTRAKPGVREVLHDGVGVGLEKFDGGYEAGIFGEILGTRILLQLGENVGSAEHAGHRTLRTIHALPGNQNNR